MPIYGAEGGYHTAGDIVRETIDGRDINGLWDEFQAVLQIVNSQRTTITNLLSFRTTRSADLVAQSTEDSGFDLASEFGVPTALRPEHPLIKVGFSFRDYDKASRATWRFLRDATTEQVQATHRAALSADNKLTTEAILARVLNPTPGENEDGVPAFGLYNGDDMAPPRSGFQTFTAGHDHYLTSESDTLDGKDLDDLARHVSHHGYGSLPGTRLLLFVNPEDLPAVASIRAGDNGATYDFITSEGAPAYLATDTLVGDRPPGEFNGLRIAGSYGDVWIAPVEMLPPGYLIMAATDGPNGSLNAVGFREHPTPAFQGLRLMPGNQNGYPLVESFYARAFGVGVRHRGAAAVLQITPSALYTPPAELAGVVL
ncbi:hypothetical protein [Pseudonocardia sp.]|uniref:hypothetical protein n=1 Tax=Pseudonocardia sp. TaxID=60912 RepID=UPI002637A4B2|nr:hypothetical protein [Pseudonocardia sp.]